MKKGYTPTACQKTFFFLIFFSLIVEYAILAIVVTNVLCSSSYFKLKITVSVLRVVCILCVSFLFSKMLTSPSHVHEYYLFCTVEVYQWCSRIYRSNECLLQFSLSLFHYKMCRSCVNFSCAVILIVNFVGTLLFSLFVAHANCYESHRKHPADNNNNNHGKNPKSFSIIEKKNHFIEQKQ